MFYSMIATSVFIKFAQVAVISALEYEDDELWWFFFDNVEEFKFYWFQVIDEYNLVRSQFGWQQETRV